MPYRRHTAAAFSASAPSWGTRRNSSCREDGRLREEEDEGLAVQVSLQRMDRVRFTDVHMSQLRKLTQEPSFTSDLTAGTGVSRERHTLSTRGTRDRDVEMRAPSSPPLEENGGGGGGGG